MPQHDYNNIVYKRDSAAAALREAQALLAEAYTALDNTVIRSEIAGVVAAVNVEAGDQATPGKPLVSVVDPDNLKVLIHVIENDLPLIRPGMPAEVSFPGGGRIKTKVGQTYPTLDNKTRSATVEIPLPTQKVREQKVCAGMSADVSLVLAKQSNALLLPAEAVVERQGKSYVFIVKDGKAWQTEVETGISDWQNVAIASGINAGDQVVLSPPSDLRDGQVVYIFDGGNN
jgi:RND family efflux transporter MFP subunit